MTAGAGQRPDLHAPGEVVGIARRLEEAGYSTWAVGGAIRDVLAGRPAGDWDLATAARPRDVQRLFRRTVPVGVKHGTVGVLDARGVMHEVTTFRRDVETDGRHAVVRFSDSIDEDLERRDFTINAVAWHPLTRELRDPHGGVRDLADGVLRTVGDARERFLEDRLRVLRALRFAGRFGLRVDPDTWRAVREAAPDLPHLSAERVREELIKVLREVARPADALQLYESSGVLAVLYPELAACVGFPDARGELWSHLMRTAGEVPRHRPWLRLTALLHDAGKPRVPRSGDGFPGHAEAGAALAQALLTRLRCANADIDRTMHLVAQHSGLPACDAPGPVLRRWLRRVGRRFLPDLLRLRAADLRGHERVSAMETVALARLGRRARAELRRGVPLQVGELAIGGGELRSLGLAPGPEYGRILGALLEWVIEDPARNHPALLLARARELA